MQITSLTALGSDFAQKEFNKSVGLEGFSDVVGFVSSKLTQWITKQQPAVQNLLPVESSGRFPSKLEKLLTKVTYDDLANVAIYQPDGMSGYMQPYSKLLLALVSKIGNIEARLYVPLTEYVEGVLSNPSNVDQIWVPKDLKIVSIDKELAELAKVFNPKAKGHAVHDKALFKDRYTSIGDYIGTGKAISELEAEGKQVDVKSLAKAEARLFNSLTMYIKIAKEDNSVVTINKVTISKLTQAVEAIIVETEALAMVIYQINVLQTAFADSNTKLTDNLS